MQCVEKTRRSSSLLGWAPCQIDRRLHMRRTLASGERKYQDSIDQCRCAGTVAVGRGSNRCVLSGIAVYNTHTHIHTHIHTHTHTHTICAVSGIAGGTAQCIILTPSTFLVMTAATTGRPVIETLGQMARGERKFADLYTGGGSLSPSFSLSLSLFLCKHTHTHTHTHTFIHVNIYLFNYVYTGPTHTHTHTHTHTDAA